MCMCVYNTQRKPDTNGFIWPAPPPPSTVLGSTHARCSEESCDCYDAHWGFCRRWDCITVHAHAADSRQTQACRGLTTQMLSAVRPPHPRSVRAVWVTWRHSCTSALTFSLSKPVRAASRRTSSCKTSTRRLCHGKPDIWASRGKSDGAGSAAHTGFGTCQRVLSAIYEGSRVVAWNMVLQTLYSCPGMKSLLASTRRCPHGTGVLTALK